MPPEIPDDQHPREDGADADAGAAHEDDTPRLEIEDALDLHTFAPRDVPTVVTEYLWEAMRAGWSEVRIIHGKGIGVQRRIVAAILEKHPAVESFQQAPAERGHWGATLVRLRKATRDAQ